MVRSLTSAGRAWRAGRQLAQGVLQLLFPAVCGACGRSLSPGEIGFCLGCRTELTTDPLATCPRCAGSIGAHALIEGRCSQCRDSHFHFEKAARLGPYEGLLREVVLRLKHHTGEMLAELMGELWVEVARPRFLEVGADMVIPVPLHWWRHWRRGYNQSEALANRIASRLQLPCRSGWLRRIRHTPRQTLQTPSERKENVRGAFRARSWARLRGKVVLLVDDVLTTGTTCSEAARALREAGAAQVVVGVLARSHNLGRF